MIYGKKRTGERAMNLINDEEKKRISEIAGGIKIEKRKKEESYYLNRLDKETRTVSDIQEFEYNSPLELQKQLCEIWSKLSDDKMQEFQKVCCVSAFKNRENEEQGQKVSTYIYEF